MVPVTTVGHLLAIATMFWGLIIMALPITVIGTNFARVLREMQAENMLNHLDTIDANGDGEADMNELKRLIQAIKGMGLDGDEFQNAESLIAAYDIDGNGTLSAEELSHLKEDLKVITGFRDYKERNQISSSRAEVVAPRQCWPMACITLNPFEAPIRRRLTVYCCGRPRAQRMLGR